MLNSEGLISFLFEEKEKDKKCYILMKTPSWVSNIKKIKEELGKKIKNLNQQLFDLDEIKRENGNLN